MYLESCYNLPNKVRVGKEEADLVNVCIIGEHCDATEASYKYCNSASPFFQALASPAFAWQSNCARLESTTSASSRSNQSW